MARYLVYSTFYGLPDFTSLSMRNHLYYCLKNNYDYRPYFSNKPTERQFSWAKIYLAMEILSNNTYDAIFWMDADSLFLNPSIRLETLLARSQASIHFTGDENDIFNGGHFILRNTPHSMRFLESCWKVCYTQDPRFFTTHKDDVHLYDQPAILSVLGGADPNDPETWSTGFNAVNGFPENPYRIVSDFQVNYSPRNPQNCKSAQRLICSQWRDHCYIHPQRAMNSYPWYMGPDDFIVHFVGNTKHLMRQWREIFSFYPDYACTF